MCGIWNLIYSGGKSREEHQTGGIVKDIPTFFQAFLRFKGRGPENSDFKIMSQYSTIIGFHRLAINGLKHVQANQPYVFDSLDDARILPASFFKEQPEKAARHTVTYTMCNGEIYNFQVLAAKHNITLHGLSDCEIVYPLYKLLGGEGMMRELDSESAIIVCEVDKSTGATKTFVSRDVCGIRPLYVAQTTDGAIAKTCFSSELKGIPFLHLRPDEVEAQQQLQLSQFPARCWTEITITDANCTSAVPPALHYNEFFSMNAIPATITDRSVALKVIRDEFVSAVKSRIDHCHREFACLLSGGLDSSLVSGITSFEVCKPAGKQLRTFCLGMCEKSPDLYYAQQVADHIGSNHTAVIIPEKEWLEAVKEVIYTIETYDITTVRASTGQFLISRWINKNTDVKVLLIGDGSDELTGGYLYFKNAPSPAAFQEEILKLMNNIHFYDVQRSDRGIASNGLEARVPFLRRKFIEAYLSIDVSLRMPKWDEGEMEKQLLRDAFKDSNYVPQEVLYRKKEAFSDGVSKHERSWFSVLQESIDKMYTQEEFETKRQKYMYHEATAPTSKEALYYREIYEQTFGTSEQAARLLPKFWLPNWSGDIKEPSARVLDHYHRPAVVDVAGK